METYIVLVNFTQQGITNVKDAPSRAENFRRAVETAGGKLMSWYLTIGHYDLVVTVQVPDGNTIAKLLLSTGALGFVRTETLRAFALEEAKKIFASMP
ncbi:MAG TPA: GYD domain-containing protein [Burkholderiales bacterium]|nr:GYD domain-containing protein [Burkholderiales bacterium]